MRRFDCIIETASFNQTLALNLTLWRAVGSPGTTWTDQGATGITRQTGADPSNWIQKRASDGFRLVDFCQRAERADGGEADEDLRRWSTMAK